MNKPIATKRAVIHSVTLRGLIAWICFCGVAGFLLGYLRGG